MKRVDFTTLNLTAAFVSPNCAPRAALPRKNALASEKPFIEDEKGHPGREAARRQAKRVREQAEGAAAKRSADTERAADRLLVTGLPGFSARLDFEAVNSSNERIHHMATRRRTTAQRNVTSMVLGRSPLFPSMLELLDVGLEVVLTRIAPRALDDDGNVTSLKACRDGVADALGLPNDKDPRVSWKYAQARAGVREYAVQVEISKRRPPCPTCGATP